MDLLIDGFSSASSFPEANSIMKVAARAALYVQGALRRDYNLMTD